MFEFSEGYDMAISYNKLWKLLIDKKMSTVELRKAADIAPNTLTRMKRDQEVTMQVLERICEVLHADFGEIVEYLSDEDNEQLPLSEQGSSNHLL